ncbi:MAG: helix-turn-helix transcriptional regulator [Anaerovoracaceae bacterium]
MDNSERIYDNVKAICSKKGVSVRKMESKAGLSNGTVSKWNEVSPTVDNLSSVAEVLGVSITTLRKAKNENQ